MSALQRTKVLSEAAAVKIGLLSTLEFWGFHGQFGADKIDFTLAQHIFGSFIVGGGSAGFPLANVFKAL